MSSKKVKVGVFVPQNTQLLDLATVDIIGMASKEYLQHITFLPRKMRDIAPSVSISYIAPGETFPTTSDARMQATHGLSHLDVQPGKLDVLLIPGPEPDASFDEETFRFLRGHAGAPDTDILALCTGTLLCAASGIAAGKMLCGPRGLQDGLKKKYPETKFVGETYRWVQDGNIWSSGGITNGNDLVAAYILSGKHFPTPVAEIVCKIAEVGDRPQAYTQRKAAFMIGILWQITKAMFTKVR